MKPSFIKKGTKEITSVYQLESHFLFNIMKQENSRIKCGHSQHSKSNVI